ncbi:hypothetical protein QMZ20_18610 [Serratia bockelmannii]|nr:hypothetical protein [Serratia bockelmannii]
MNESDEISSNLFPSMHEPDTSAVKRYPLTLSDYSASLSPPSLKSSAPAPLVIFFHGAGGEDAGALAQLHNLSETFRFILFAPRSGADSWDLLRGGWGEDADAVVRQLAWLKNRYKIDDKHIVMAGFSDGASYALSLGGRCAEVTHSVAWSPGFYLGNVTGKNIFISHADNDRVLPYCMTQRMARELEVNNNNLIFRFHQAGHSVPGTFVEDALHYCLAADRIGCEQKEPPVKTEKR